MTNLKTNIFHSTKLRSAWMVLVLFSGSVLGGMMFAYITKPKEACAQCVDLGYMLDGGSYTETIPPDGIGCQSTNPFTGGCSCPSGYSMSSLDLGSGWFMGICYKPV